jgi:hypothetical protein
MRRRLVVLVLSLGLFGCGGSTSDATGGEGDVGGVAGPDTSGADVVAPDDTLAPDDARDPDAALEDAGSEVDASGGADAVAPDTEATDTEATDTGTPVGCCDPQSTFCDNDDVACIGGFCIPLSTFTPGTCTTDAECSGAGYVCVGASAASGSCESGGTAPVYGTCQPNGPGGLCLLVTPGLFGACEAELGWSWTGSICEVVSGCACGDFCDAVFESESACLAACSPPVCCATDAACGEGRVCRDGQCLAAPAAGACYSATDCDGAAVCAAAMTCPCTMKSCGGATPPPIGGGPVHAGVCQPLPTCCADGTGCGDGKECVVSGFGTLRCHDVPAPGGCWTATDCAAGQYCVGSAPCSCDDPFCLPIAGTCTAMPATCCVTTADCVPGMACTAVQGEIGKPAPWHVEVGRCVSPPATGCYGDADCASDAQCIGFEGSACDAPDGLIPAGFCEKKDGLCCGSDAWCAAGLECAFAGAEQSICKPTPAAEGACWDDSDCAALEVCRGAEVCGGCGPCSGESKVGACESPVGVCCETDGDCTSEEWCTATTPKAWSPPGVGFGQCVPKGASGSCTTDAHCSGGETCSFGGYPCGAPYLSPEGFPMVPFGYCATP